MTTVSTDYPQRESAVEHSGSSTFRRAGLSQQSSDSHDNPERRTNTSLCSRVHKHLMESIDCSLVEVFQRSIPERSLNCEDPCRIYIISTKLLFHEWWDFWPTTQSLILGHCRPQHCPPQRHCWLMSMPEQLCLCPCL